MTDGFKKHNIDHTSASQINMWADCPAAWIKSYLYNSKGFFGFPPMRGIVIEDIVVATLQGNTFEDALKAGTNKYNSHHILSDDPKKEKEKAMIEPCALLMLKELEQYGEPEFQGDGQDKVELVCNGDGFSIKIIGFLDLVFPKFDLNVDLKSTGRLPRSKFSDSHKRQCGIYEAATGRKTKFLYASAKDTMWHEIETAEEMAATMAQIKAILNRQNKFIGLGDKDMLASVVPVNADSFYLNAPEDTADRIKLFGI